MRIFKAEDAPRSIYTCAVCGETFDAERGGGRALFDHGWEPRCYWCLGDPETLEDPRA